MTDAFHDAIRDRERHEKRIKKGVTVYVVKIGHKTLNDAVIGPVYWDEAAARAEVDRLNAANSYTRASYVSRVLPERTRVGWGND